MKRRDLIRLLRENGAEFVREGGEHTVYRNPRTDVLLAIPRHAEIKEHLAKALVRKASE